MFEWTAFRVEKVAKEPKPSLHWIEQEEGLARQENNRCYEAVAEKPPEVDATKSASEQFE